MSNLIAVIGAGGKTTALKLLARQSGLPSVLLATSTHFYPMASPDCRICLRDPSAEDLLRALQTPGIVCAGSTAKEGKLGALPEHVFRPAAEAASLVLYEGDGARFHPLKLHRPGEPVILPGTQRCLVVAGLSALGKPVGEAVHSYGQNPASQEAATVGTPEFLHCVLETAEASGLPRTQLRVFLNQAETLSDAGPAVEITAALRELGISARFGSLRQAPDFLWPWVTE